MEEKENLYTKIQELLGKLEGNFSILEEQVDIDTQLKYFEVSKELKTTLNIEETVGKKDSLFSDSLPLEEKKTLLVHLASINKVEAFRTIEKYNQNPDAELKDWGILAFQESKMLLESTLLDQNQVLISTGLGGKQSKLRYFVVFIGQNNSKLEDYQKKIVKTELEFLCRKNNSIVEEMNFIDRYVTFKILIPIKTQFSGLLEESIAACNQFGNFLDRNFIVTNVKELSLLEIEEVLQKTEHTDLSDEEDL